MLGIEKWLLASCEEYTTMYIFSKLRRIIVWVDTLLPDTEEIVLGFDEALCQRTSPVLCHTLPTAVHHALLAKMDILAVGFALTSPVHLEFVELFWQLYLHSFERY